MRWFLSLQLNEYQHLFQENQDTAWLDKIDKRYAWLKRHLLELEERLGNMFPASWEVSERITVEFCNITRWVKHHITGEVPLMSTYPFNLYLIFSSLRNELTKLMAKRTSELDVKLLLYAIQRTANFESLLARRFTGITLRENSETAQQISSSQVFAYLIKFVLLFKVLIVRGMLCCLFSRSLLEPTHLKMGQIQLILLKLILEKMPR